MLRKLKLYGELAQFVGHKEFEIQVDSLAKAVSFLVNNFPQVEKYMNPQYYQVKIGDYAVNEEEIHHPIGQQDIHSSCYKWCWQHRKSIIRCSFDWNRNGNWWNNFCKFF